MDKTHVNRVVSVNANYTAIMPFRFIKNLEHAEIIHNSNRQWYGETRARAKQYIEKLKESEY
jgi:hypothetical protein